MDILENIVIGNFLFGLGVKMGMGHYTTPVEPIAVNLLQQGPLDQAFGDVIVANSRIFRLIEFKRKKNTSQKERAKWKLISDALDTEAQAELHAISRRVHWYVESDFRAARSEIGIVPYLDFPKPAGRIVLTDFIEATAKEATAPQGEREAHYRRRYIELIAMCHGRAGSSGCLLVVVTARGELQYVAVDDLRELIMTPQLVLERYHAQELHMANKLALEQAQTLEHSENLSLEL